MSSEVVLIDGLNEKRSKYLKTLEECFGNLTKAAHIEAIDRHTVYYWIENIDGFKSAFDLARKRGKRLRYDVLVNVIEQAAIDGDHKAALKILERNYKKGAEDDSESWTLRVEHTGGDGKPMELIQFYMPENSRDESEDEDETD